jgi:hypothetical protein
LTFRFSGHETFPCRYAWLPKAVRALASSPKALSDEENAMVELGVGKNMVRAIRFWVQAAGMAVSRKDVYDLTEFGRELVDEGGLDPFFKIFGRFGSSIGTFPQTCLIRRST